MQHEHQRRRVQPAVVDRQRLELAAAQVDVVESLQPFARRLQHRRGRVHRDHARSTNGAKARRSPGRCRSRDRRRSTCVPRARRTPRDGTGRRTAPRARDPTGRPRRTRIPRRLRPSAGERNHLQPPLILRAGRRRPHLLADKQPQTACRRIELGHFVQVARPLGARGDPAAVAQRLQVPAHRRLRELHDGAQLRDGQLVAIEEGSRMRLRVRIGQRRPGDRGWRVRGQSFNPYIRLKGYIISIAAAS